MKPYHTSHRSHWSYCALVALICSVSCSAAIPIGIDGAAPPHELKLDFIYVLHQWQDKPGDEAAFKQRLETAKQNGYKVAVTFTNVHMDQKHLPESVSKLSFSD